MVEWRDGSDVWRTGGLTWPQRNWLSGYDLQSDDEHGDNQLYELTLRDPVTADRACSAVARLVHRHEALRTTFATGSDGTIDRQRVASPAEIEMELQKYVVRAAPHDYLDAVEAIESTVIRIAESWPLRIILRDRAGVVDAISVVIDHSACDAWGGNVLTRDLEYFLEDAGSGPDVDDLGRPGQPLGLVEWERSEAGVRRLRKGLEFWRQQMDGVQAALGPGGAPAAAVLHDSDAPYQSFWMRSRGLLPAARKHAAWGGVPVSALILQAYGLALSESAGSGGIGISMLVANRTVPGFQDSVANMFMQAPVVVNRSDSTSEKGGLRRIFAQQVQAYRVGAVDPVELDLLVAERLPNAMSLDIMGAYFNYMDTSVGPGAEAVVQLGDGADRWEDGEVFTDPLRPRGAPLMLAAMIVRDEIELRLTVRTDLAWAGEAESILRRIATHVRG